MFQRSIIPLLSIFFFFSCVDTGEDNNVIYDPNMAGNDIVDANMAAVQTAGSINMAGMMVIAGEMTAGMTTAPVLINAPGQIIVGTYNVENLFDLVNDPATDEGEFTPGPSWTQNHVNARIANLAQAIAGINADVLALEEVESAVALSALVQVLKINHNLDYPYQAVSPTRDLRGIRPALISKIPFVNAVHRPINSEYQCDNGTVLNGSKPEARFVYQVDFQFMGETQPSMTLLINHWKSRAASDVPCKVAEHQRRSGQFVNQLVQNLQTQNPLLNVVVLGDFNAIENELSIMEDLSSKTTRLDLTQPYDLYNLWGELGITPGQGDATRATYYYRNEWFRLDHIHVSQSFLNKNPGAWALLNFELVRLPFLLQDGRPWGWNNDQMIGFSDHLPVKATFFRR